MSLLVSSVVLGTAIVAYAELAHRRTRKETKPKQSLFHVTATPETRARMELWRQQEASPVPEDLVLVSKLEYYREELSHGLLGRMMYKHDIQVDFGSGAPEFSINDVGQKVPKKYPPFERNGCIVYGLWASAYEPEYGNVWQCSIDYFEEKKRDEQ